jgi:hypothetical protein
MFLDRWGDPEQNHSFLRRWHRSDRPIRRSSHKKNSEDANADFVNHWKSIGLILWWQSIFNGLTIAFSKVSLNVGLNPRILQRLDEILRFSIRYQNPFLIGNEYLRFGTVSPLETAWTHSDRNDPLQKQLVNVYLNGSFSPFSDRREIPLW